MRILFALPYGPSVTRVRSRMLLEEISARHDITIIALVWDNDDGTALAEWRARGVDVHAIQHSRASRVAGVRGWRDHPLQYNISTSQRFARRARSLIDDARRSGRPYTAVHVEHLRGAAALDLFRPLGARTIFDAVDCLAELARLSRQHCSHGIVRAIAAVEEERTRRVETQLLRAVDVVTVVAERDKNALLANQSHDNVIVVPNGVVVRPAPHVAVEEPVAVFTGKLSYHANQTAARWLLRNIWPKVRASLPNATLIVAGADPPAWLSKRSGMDGVTVVANPYDMSDVIVRARVALAPVVYSVGIQNKVLEAMGVGVPVVATPAAANGLLHGSANALALADTADSFVAETVRLLRGGPDAALLGRSGHEYVLQHHSWPSVACSFETLYAGAAVAEQVA